MQIIISPAKKMRIDNDDLVSAAEPRFLKDTEILLAELRKMQYDDLKKLWQCNDEIAHIIGNQLPLDTQHQFPYNFLLTCHNFGQVERHFRHTDRILRCMARTVIRLCRIQ